MPKPLRVFENELTEMGDERIVFRRTVSNYLIVVSAILGILALVAGRVLPIPSQDTPSLIYFIITPGVFLTFGALFMYGYNRYTVIDVVRDTVEVRQTIFIVPAQSYSWNLSDFDAVIVWLQTPGRESKPGLYFTVALEGADKAVSLLDLENHKEASKTARELADRLGLKTTETLGG